MKAPESKNRLAAKPVLHSRAPLAKGGKSAYNNSMKKMTKQTQATLLALLAYFLWGFSFLFSRLGMNEALPFVMLAHRFTLAAAAMGLLALTGVVKLRLRGKRVGRLLLMGLCEPVIYFIFEAYGILYTTTAFSGVVLAAIPIVALFASALFLRERVTGGQVIWSLISVAGVVVYALQGSNDGSVTAFGAICLVLAVFSSVGFTLLSRTLADEFSSFERTFIGTLEGMAAFWLLAAVQCHGEPSALIAPLGSGSYWLAIGYLGLVASIGGYGLLNYALSHLPVSRVSIGTNLITVISVFAGIVFLHEPFSALSLGCSAAILIGIYGAEHAASGKDAS